MHLKLHELNRIEKMTQPLFRYAKVCTLYIHNTNQADLRPSCHALAASQKISSKPGSLTGLEPLAVRSGGEDFTLQPLSR